MADNRAGTGCLPADGELMIGERDALSMAHLRRTGSLLQVSWGHRRYAKIATDFLPKYSGAYWAIYELQAQLLGKVAPNDIVLTHDLPCDLID